MPLRRADPSVERRLDRARTGRRGSRRPGRDAWTRLAAESMTRDPAAFEVLLGGGAGVGGVYDLWRRAQGAGQRASASPRARRASEPVERFSPCGLRVPSPPSPPAPAVPGEPAALPPAAAAAGVGAAVLGPDPRPQRGGRASPPAVEAALASAGRRAGGDRAGRPLDRRAPPTIVARHRRARPAGPAGAGAAAAGRLVRQAACLRRAGPSSRGTRCCVFLDADVRLSPDALARMAASWTTAGVGLASGFPRQETGTFAERLVIPLIHFLLLGFLPIVGDAAVPPPAFGAGCGQLFIARARCLRQSRRPRGDPRLAARRRHPAPRLPPRRAS